MAVNVYHSTDTGAPVVSNVVGDLINLLDKCLVTGYGSKAAAGWTKPYTGTNLAVFRMGGGNQRYLRVDDTMVGTSRYARIVGYETMSAVSTGTGAFPTEAQVPSGLYLHASNAATAGQRDWTLVATDKLMYLMLSPAVSLNYPQLTIFGDFNSYNPADQYNTVLIAVTATNVASGGNGMQTGTNVATTLSGHYVARKFDQLGASTPCGKITDSSKNGGVGFGSNASAIAYPNPVDGGLYLAPAWVCEPTAQSSGILRGLLPGLWCVCHPPGTFQNNDTFAGSGTLAGKTFIIKTYGSSGASGAFALETSNTW